MPKSLARPSFRLAAFAALLAAAGAQPALAQSTDGSAAPATADQAQTAAPDTAAPAQQAQPQQAQPQPQVVATHGDWSVICLDGAPPCVMRQSGFTAQGQEIMEISIRRIETRQTQQGTVEAVMDVRVPLGVLLREGLAMQIDSAQAQRGQYTICLSEGCLMREPLPNAMVSSLKRGASAKFGFIVPQGAQPQELTSDISLNGFTAAYDDLGARQ